ncbi:MAG: serine/threonine protein kinase [Myxococcaceae bacterium]|nr:MAG: serine/threonine protein kinase [Myxococcaceae bacterium]
MCGDVESASTEALTLPPGSVVGGKYQVLHQVGAGGMGAVYEARNSWTGRRVALKLLHAHRAKSEEGGRCFLREAKAASKIAHPNIIDVLDMGQDADTGALFIVQELLEGEDLGHRMAGEPRLTLREALQYVIPVMSALVAAHYMGVVHRDIKPENVFLSRSGRGGVVPKLIDFGISKILDEPGSDPSKSLTSGAVGTPEYMSPEQVRCRSDIDGRADVWSVGVMLYELASTRLPFEAPNQHLLVLAILTTPARRIESIAPWVPPGLARVIHRALETEVGDRYPSMAEFLRELIDCDLGDGVPLVRAEDRHLYMTDSRARQSVDPLLASPAAEAPAEALVPTADAPAEPTVHDRARTPTIGSPRGRQTLTEWQKPLASSWLPVIVRPQLAGIASACVVVLALAIAIVSGSLLAGRATVRAGLQRHEVRATAAAHRARMPLRGPEATVPPPIAAFDAGAVCASPRRPSPPVPATLPQAGDTLCAWDHSPAQ